MSSSLKTFLAYSRRREVFSLVWWSGVARKSGGLDSLS